VRTCLEPGGYIGGGGLRLRVQSNGGRTWILRIAIRSISRDIALGPRAALSLVGARAKAKDIRRAVVERRNPVEERRAARKPLTPVVEMTVVDDRVPALAGCGQ